MNEKLHLVVMAGGTGTRLWPKSRQSNPKQFLDVLGKGRTLLQATCDRFEELVSPKDMIIASNDQYSKILREQLPKFSKNQFFLEPSKKNTAPCIAYAAYKLAKKDLDIIMIVSPSDHAISEEKKFISKVKKAVSAARDGKLVTIGITPDRPETGYGYIQFIEEKGDVKKVKTFTEKPQEELAKKFIESGDFAWNAGIFVWRVGSIIEAFEQYEPEMAEIFGEVSKYYYTRKERRFVHQAYAQCRNISIDYAIMEKADNVHCVMGDFGWSDLGSWQTIHDHQKKDKNQNSISGEVLIEESQGNLIDIRNGKVAVIEGLDDFLVMDSEDVLVIVPKNDPSRFQKIVREIKKRKGDDLL